MTKGSLAALAFLVCLAPGTSRAETLRREYGPYSLEPNHLMIMPGDRSAIRFKPGRLITAIEMLTTDGAGRALERGFICHNNIGPDMRHFEHGRKVLLDGYTRSVRMPAGFGIALEKSDFLTELMYNNPTASLIDGVKTRFNIELAPEHGAGLSALYPQMMSVFEQPEDVAPGDWGYYVRARSKDRRTRLYDVLADYEVRHVSFHIHDKGRRLLLTEKATGAVLVDARTSYDAAGNMTEVPQVGFPDGLTLKKGQVLELAVDYDNPTDKTIDAMGAAILFGRCTAEKPDCDAVAQRPADNAWFDAKLYYSLLKEPVPEQSHEHHHHH